MSTQNRYNVVPTVTVLAVMKGRLTGAVKGHALLKKKADALTMRFRQVSNSREAATGSMSLCGALQGPPSPTQARLRQALWGSAKHVAAAPGLLTALLLMLCLLEAASSWHGPSLGLLVEAGVLFIPPLARIAVAALCPAMLS